MYKQDKANHTFTLVMEMKSLTSLQPIIALKIEIWYINEGRAKHNITIF